jgi:uroporphyrinogen III methyltransferase/synthase
MAQKITHPAESPQTLQPAHPGNGIVYLVGAGPGDPGLLTVRGAQLLEHAQVVVHDALANPQLLSYCPHAKRINVGKRAGLHAATQEQINAILVEQGQLGFRVVRLKGGDPFVFGRGGEECQALAQAGIPFEIVPGITSGIAAPAYAGIPGSPSDDESATADIDFATLARLPSLAFYMGARSLDRICSKLMENGMSPQTPAATIQWGTTPKQRTAVATIKTLPDAVRQAGIGSPAITIVGRVAELRGQINWFENRPLFGQTILITRTGQQASQLSRQLESAGATVLEAPTIELSPPADWSTIDAALQDAAKMDWIVFTSVNGVEFTRQRLLETGRDTRTFGKARIAAVGNATATAVRDRLCLNVDLCPKSFVAEALGEAFAAANEIAGRRFLLLRADIARPVLVESLRQGDAAEVRDVSVYESHPAKSLPPDVLAALESGQIDWITFASSSSARNLAELLGPHKNLLNKVRLASIGPITTKTITDLGLTPTVEAKDHDIPGLVAAIKTAGKNF